MAYDLRPVTTPAEWRAMHDIRLATLFAPGRHGDGIVYDEQHPDDLFPRNQPFLLWLDGAPIGVVRFDRNRPGSPPTDGIVRLVAITPELQGSGHGRAMDALVVQEALRHGVTRLCVNAHNSAVGFYEKTGWRIETWDAAELVGIAAHCTQMVKTIG